MAKDARKMSGVPAKNGGNRTNPAIAGKVGMPGNHKNTYGVGDGAGGGSSPAKNGGNRTNPAIAGKVGMPGNHDGYMPPVK